MAPPSLFSRFRAPTLSSEEGKRERDRSLRSSTTGVEASRPSSPVPPLPTPAHAPSLIVTQDDTDSIVTPESPGSIHRQSSIGTPEVPQKDVQYIASSLGHSRTLSDNLPNATINGGFGETESTPKAALPPYISNGTVPSADKDKNPFIGSNGLAPDDSPTSSKVKKKQSQQSVKAPSHKSASRRSSTSSSNEGSVQHPLVDSPKQIRARSGTNTSSGGDGRRSSEDAYAQILQQKDTKKTWRKPTGPFAPRKGTGGIAGALAASGMSLANPGIITPPPLPPMPVITRKVSAHSVEQPRRTSMDVKGRPRQPSAASSGFGGSNSDEDSDDVYDSPDRFGFDDDMPITGFAVASSKRNADFHELFPRVPEGDYLIEDYGCAIQRDILVQGRLYISENHICFHASIFGWVTNLTIAFNSITLLEKRMTAFVIPNAIQVTTHDAKYTFASFLSRDTTFDVITNIWKLSHPRSRPGSPGSEDGGGYDPDALPTPGAGIVPTTPGAGAVGGGVKHKATVCVCGKSGQHYAEVPMEIVVPGTPEKIYNLMFASGFIKDFMANDQKLFDIQMSDWRPETGGSNLLTRNMSYIKPLTGSLGPKQTKCELEEKTLHVDFDDYVSTLTTTRTPDVPSGGVFSVKTRTCIMWAGPSSAKVVVTSVIEWTGRSFIKSIIERSAMEGQRGYHRDLEAAMRKYITEHRTEFLGENDDPMDIIPQDGVNSIMGDILVASPTTESHPATIGYELKKGDTQQRGLQWALDTATGTTKVAKESFWGAIDLLGDILSGEGRPSIWVVIVLLLVGSNLWTLSSLRGTKSKKEKEREEMRKQMDMRAFYPPSAPVTAVVRPEDAFAEAFKLFLEGMKEGKGVGVPPSMITPRPELKPGATRDDGKSAGGAVKEVEDIEKTLAGLEARIEKIRALLKVERTEVVSREETS